MQWLFCVELAWVAALSVLVVISLRMTPEDLSVGAGWGSLRTGETLGCKDAWCGDSDSDLLSMTFNMMSADLGYQLVCLSHCTQLNGAMTKADIGKTTSGRLEGQPSLKSRGYRMGCLLNSAFVAVVSRVEPEGSLISKERG